LKHRFCLFYKKKKFYSKDEKVESFIKNEENIYYGKSRLPQGTSRGLLFTIFLSTLLTIVSFYLFKHSLHRLNAAKNEDNPPTGMQDATDTTPPKKKDLALKHGEYHVVRIYGERFKDYTYNDRKSGIQR